MEPEMRAWHVSHTSYSSCKLAAPSALVMNQELYLRELSKWQHLLNARLSLGLLRPRRWPLACLKIVEEPSPVPERVHPTSAQSCGTSPPNLLSTSTYYLPASLAAPSTTRFSCHAPNPEGHISLSPRTPRPFHPPPTHPSAPCPRRTSECRTLPGSPPREAQAPLVPMQEWSDS